MGIGLAVQKPGLRIQVRSRFASRIDDSSVQQNHLPSAWRPGAKGHCTDSLLRQMRQLSTCALDSWDARSGTRRLPIGLLTAVDLKQRVPPEYILTIRMSQQHTTHLAEHVDTWGLVPALTALGGSLDTILEARRLL